MRIVEICGLLGVIRWGFHGSQTIGLNGDPRFHDQGSRLNPPPETPSSDPSSNASEVM